MYVYETCRACTSGFAVGHVLSFVGFSNVVFLGHDDNVLRTCMRITYFRLGEFLLVPALAK